MPATFVLGTQDHAVDDWQVFLNRQMHTWNVDLQIPVTGVYDQATRALTRSVLHGLGFASATEALKDGLTPELRVKVRNKRLTAAELARYHSTRRLWRERFRLSHKARKVAPPIAVVFQDSWGYHPPVHDGLDLICREDAPLFAMCDGEIVRADASGWWGKGAKASAGHPVSDGDGVIVLRCSVNAGPFKPGLNFVYGHAEHATVKAGDRVKAGQVIGRAGYANAPHVHLCVNGREDAKGVGDRDPRPFYDYTRRIA